MRHLKSIWIGLYFSLAGTLIATAPAQAIPFVYDFNETISSTTISGLAAGQAAQITVTLDNGIETNISQIWTEIPIAHHRQSGNITNYAFGNEFRANVISNRISDRRNNNLSALLSYCSGYCSGRLSHATRRTE